MQRNDSQTWRQADGAREALCRSLLEARTPADVAASRGSLADPASLDAFVDLARSSGLR